MSEKTKVQRAVDHIFAHPGTRSTDLATIFDCQPAHVPAYMKDIMKLDLIVSCKVEKPDGSSCYEYKPSASAPSKAPDLKEWRANHVAIPVKPLKAIKADGPRSTQKSGCSRETQAVSGDVTTAAAADSRPLGKHDLPVSEVTIETQAGSHGPEEATATASDPAVSAMSLETFVEKFARAKTRTEHLSEIDLFCTLGLSGAMSIQFKGETLHLPVSAVRELGKFLIATEPAWA